MGTLLLGNSHAIAEPSCKVLVTEWGSLLCGDALVFFPPTKQLDCLPPNGVRRREVSRFSAARFLCLLPNDVPKNFFREDILSGGNECAPKLIDTSELL